MTHIGETEMMFMEITTMQACFLGVLVGIFVFFILYVVWFYRRRFHERKFIQTIRTLNRKKLHGRELAVVVRTKDGRKTETETYLIGQLIHEGAIIQSVPTVFGNKWWSGDFLPHEILTCPIIVATVWTTKLENTDKYHMDLRVLDPPGFRAIGACVLTAISVDALLVQCVHFVGGLNFVPHQSVAI